VPTLIRFFKPFRVLSQFTDPSSRATLADFIEVANVYPAGRLDYDSEGLLLLTDDGSLQARIANPRHKFEKTYLAQVERAPDRAALDRLVAGVELRDGVSRAVRAAVVGEPTLPSRDPPIPQRHRARSAWVRVVMTTGRNREVRRMLAAVGHPVLRLIRTQIGPWKLGSLRPGEWTAESINLPR
jgi:23S rRNA pseudouridine2457 synthase